MSTEKIERIFASAVAGIRGGASASAGRSIAGIAILALVIAVLAGCSAQSRRWESSNPSYASPASGAYRANPVVKPHVEVASWYGPGFQGHPTSTGERYNQYGLTAASKTLPLGTRVRVTNPANGRSVDVRINDRGPYVRGRSLDLSRGAAQRLGITGQGVAPVVVSSPGSAPTKTVYVPRGRVAVVDYRSPRRGMKRKRWITPGSRTRHRTYRRHHTRQVWSPVGAWIADSLPRF
ncbi:MAG TPA: septal ring lytic transglycosylase RlpA family protein [Candidatus Binataceae bacterium]|nr:septal ring lytic transglycosylase RlpA family protein [Candidatus Binataceae bacterium]